MCYDNPTAPWALMMPHLDIMYLPELENFTSEILEIISEKNDLLVGSSGSSNILVWLSQSADWKWLDLFLCLSNSFGTRSLKNNEIIKVTHLSHVTESDGALTGAVHKEIALLGMELRSSYHLKDKTIFICRSRKQRDKTCRNWVYSSKILIVMKIIGHLC